MERLARLASGLAGMVLLASSAWAGQGAEAEIRARLGQWTQAFNSGDTTTACELFSQSLISDYRGQGEADYATRCALIAKALGDPQRRFHYAADIKEVIVEGDLAVVRLTWTLTISPGDIKSVEPGMDVFRREDDGRWRIIRYIAYEE